MTTTTPQTIMMTMGVSHSATPTTTPRHGSGAVDVPSAMEKKEEGGVHRKTSDGVPRNEGAVGHINEEMALHREGRHKAQEEIDGLTASRVEQLSDRERFTEQ
mmetsp:Transcript_6734/g.20499  ORF Transcript_6734/g.20499 Transcript_6734/m.20499 type:complete len:103 (+) Transcript_6734:394-702(+)